MDTWLFTRTSDGQTNTLAGVTEARAREIAAQLSGEEGCAVTVEREVED